MTAADSHTHAHGHHHAHGDPKGPPAGLDPANQSLAEALNKSFAVLKFIMLVLVVVYFFSGLFSVKPNEKGVVVRFGRIVGAGPGETGGETVLEPGWHWSWPYPFDRWITVPVNERQIKAEFLFQLDEGEQATGEIKGYKYNALSPERDDYLITGDVNILHAAMTVKYKVTDVVSYLRNVYPSPSDSPGLRPAAEKLLPEYTLLQSLVRNATIEAAADKEALDIRGPRQQEFVDSVIANVNRRLRALEAAGRSPGITIVSIITKKESGVEAIMPPRQVQEDFDKVYAMQSQKGRVISESQAKAGELLTEVAGGGWQALSEAIEAEYQSMMVVSAAESDGKPESEMTGQREDLAGKRGAVEKLLTDATGLVQVLVKQAEIRKNEMVSRARSEQERVQALLPEYQKNPQILLTRLRDELYSEALNNDKIVKTVVPQGVDKVWLLIPRSPSEKPDDAKKIESPFISPETLKKLQEQDPNMRLAPQLQPKMQ